MLQHGMGVHGITVQLSLLSSGDISQSYSIGSEWTREDKPPHFILICCIVRLCVCVCEIGQYIAVLLYIPATKSTQLDCQI